MKQITEFFSNIFENSLWPPRWHCGEWSDFHGWLYILSDLAIWGAYFTIPAIILKFSSQKSGIRFHSAYIWFAAFILACGLTHLIDATMFWVPMYRLNALVRFVTAIVSWFTVYHLIKLMPTALSLKSPSELEDEIKRSEVLRKQLEESNLQLQKQKDFNDRILDSTADFINVFSVNLDLISVNKLTEKRLNKSWDELVGKNFTELFPDAIGNEYHKNLRLAANGKEIKSQITKGPSGRFYETSFTPLFEKNVQYAVLVISRDITEAIEKENELKSLNHSLNEQNDRLVTANMELEQYSYILSHDLQEPLRKIVVFGNLLKERPDATQADNYLVKP